MRIEIQILIYYSIIMIFLFIEYLSGNKIRTFVISKYYRIKQRLRSFYNSLDFVERKHAFEEWKGDRCSRKGCSILDDSYGGKHPDGYVWCEHHCSCIPTGKTKDYDINDRKKSLSEMTEKEIREEYKETK